MDSQFIQEYMSNIKELNAQMLHSVTVERSTRENHNRIPLHV